MNCPICREQQCNVIMQSYDDRYGYPGLFDLRRCSNCGHGFLDICLTPEQVVHLYTNYYPRRTLDLEKYSPHQESSKHRIWFNGLRSSAFRYVPKDVRVLDVGCGFGQTLGYHAARGCEVFGVEADENIRRVSEMFGFNVHVGLFDASLYEPDFFDYVTMDQVIEHVNDPIATLRGVSQILKPGGTAILSTPNAQGWGAKCFGRRWINWHAPYHVQFFSRHSFRSAAKQAGLTLERIKTTTNSDWLYYQWIHLTLYPKPNEPSTFWSPVDQTKTLYQSRILSILALMHRAKVNHLLTRFFDSIGLGDNYVCILKKM